MKKNLYSSHNISVLNFKNISKLNIKNSYFIASYFVFLIGIVSYFYHKISISLYIDYDKIINYLLVIFFFTVVYFIINLLVSNILIKFLK